MLYYFRYKIFLFWIKMQWRVVFYFFLISIVFSSSLVAVTKLELTSREKEWLAKHPVLKAGNEFDYAPWDFNRQGKAVGYSIDYVKLLASKLDVEVKFVTDKWENLTKKLSSGELDFLHTMYQNKQRKNVIYTKPYKQLLFALYKIKHNTKLNSLDDLKDQTLSIPADDSSVLAMKKRYPGIKIVSPTNYLDALKFVILNKADATVMDIAVANYLSDTYSLNDLKIVDEVKFEKSEMSIAYHLGFRSDNQILQSIFNKAINSLSQSEIKRLDQKWLEETDDENQYVELTNEEFDWIEQHPVVKYTGDLSWLPIESFKENGEYTGIAQDYLELIEKKTGLVFEKVRPQSRIDALRMVEDQEVKMISEVISKNLVSRNMLFTKPYIKTPLIVVMKKSYSGGYITDLKQIKEKNIGIMTAYGYADALKAVYPKLRFNEVATIKEGLESVASGKLDAFVSTLAVSTYNIAQLGLSNVSIAGQLDFNVELGFGIDKESPLLLSIVNKALESITELQRNTIIHKWVQVEVNQQIDWELLFEVIGGAVLVILLIIYHNGKLKRLVDEKTSEIQSLLHAFDKNVIASTTDENGKIIYVSDAFCEISGFSREELIGKSHTILRHPDMPKETFKDLWKTLKEKKKWRGEVKNRKKDGSFYWVDVTITPECDPKGKVCTYSDIRQDITDKKKVEELTQSLEQKVEERTEELTRSEQKIRRIFATTSQGIWITDNDCITIEVNEAVCRIIGYTEEELLGKPIFSFVDEHEQERCKHHFSEHEQGEVSAYELLLKRKNGSFVPTIFNGTPMMDENGKKIGSFAMITDISELKHAQNEVVEAQEKFRFALNAMGAFGWETDLRTYTTVYANDMFYIQYGYDTTEIPRRMEEFIQFIHPDDLEENENRLSAYIQGDLDTYEDEFRFRKKDGEYVWIYNRGHATERDTKGYAEVITGITLDITERKKIEEQIKETNRKMTDSLNYASLIQDALLPSTELIKSHFDDYFSYWEPKDVVGGDIYLFEKIPNKEEILLMVIDCTGHGVPGAFVTMLVRAIERQIMGVLERTQEQVSPAKILSIFNRSIKHLLKQEEYGSSHSLSNVGFDGGIVYYDKERNILKYAGANIPLFVKSDSGLEIIKGNRHSIGYKSSDGDYEFKEVTLSITEATSFYLSTDGYVDQIGGEKGLPFGKRRFQKLIDMYHHKDMSEQKIHFIQEHQKYQGDNERIDDICFIAFRINPNKGEK